MEQECVEIFYGFYNRVYIDSKNIYYDEIKVYLLLIKL
jgi:hypothetical protein